jgi:hypothetical protein
MSMNQILADLQIALSSEINSGRELVISCRTILKLYSAAGFSIDDEEIESILAIESETDTMNIESNLEAAEFDRIYAIYRAPFKHSRASILAKLARTPTRQDKS